MTKRDRHIAQGPFITIPKSFYDALYLYFIFCTDCFHCGNCEYPCIALLWKDNYSYWIVPNSSLFHFLLIEVYIVDIRIVISINMIKVPKLVPPFRTSRYTEHIVADNIRPILNSDKYSNFSIQEILDFESFSIYSTVGLSDCIIHTS